MMESCMSHCKVGIGTKPSMYALHTSQSSPHEIITTMRHAM